MEEKETGFINWTICENTDQCITIDFLYEMSREILSCHNLKEITRSLYIKINKLLDAPYFAIAQYNETKQTLEFWGIADSDELLRTGEISLEEKDLWSVHCFLNHEELLFNSLPKDSSKHFSKLLFKTPDTDRQSFIYLPLISKKKCIGIITVQSFKPNSYDIKQIKILKSLSNFIAMAIENAVAFTTIKKQNIAIQENARLLEATIQNITDIVALRTAVIEKQNKELEMLSIIAKETNNAMMIMNREGDVLWINDWFTKLYGYSYEQFITLRGKNIRSTSFSDDIDSILEKCLKTKQPCIYQACNYKPDGTAIWTQTTLTPIFDAEGEIRSLVTVDSDITEIMDAKSVIQEQSKAIQNSIQYAGKIQTAILPSMKDISNSFNDVFIIYKPCNLISGDFYWHYTDSQWTWIVAADCTGHGVPAALLSILGISILKEISKQNYVSSASQILNRIRHIFKETIHQHGENQFIIDGLDIAICLISNDRSTLQFAGAYSSLLFIRDNEVQEIKGDHIPIGDFKNNNARFTLHTLDLQPNDKIYLFSDGFASQFGGPENKKYMKSNFINLIHKHHCKDMNLQKEILLKELDSWMLESESPQIDDVLVIGIKI